jgi:endonuclease/exonuclease/phosphatase family metal-dependent hydrolase
MVDLKMVLWNMEWMSDLYVSSDQPSAFKADTDEPFHSKGTTVLQRRKDLAGVLKALDPDIVVTVEGPVRSADLQLFYDTDMDAGAWKAEVQPSKGGTQNVGIAVRTDRGRFEPQPYAMVQPENETVFNTFSLDVDDDGIDETYKFERVPLYAEICPQGGGKFRILGLHLKSKLLMEAYEWSKWWQMADANRKKLLAQATQIRLKFLDTYMTTAATRAIPLIVCGDINDGPGLDSSEKKLFGSAVERLMVTIWHPEFCLRNALFEALPAAAQKKLDFSKIATTRFKDPIFNNVYHEEWIDHVLYTDSGAAAWVSEAKTNHILPNSKKYRDYKNASDHVPVSVILHV